MAAPRRAKSAISCTSQDNPVGCSHHAARHGEALVAHVRARPWPGASVLYWCVGRARTRPGKPQLDARFARRLAGQVEVALDAVEVLAKQRLLVDELVHGTVV